MSEEEFQREPEEDGLKAEIEKSGARTIGDFLSYERERKGLSLDEIDQVSRIGPRWLEAIDKGGWSAYPSLIYAKGHIRGYASVLGLDGSRIISEFEEELKSAFPDETFHIHPVRNINQIYQPTSGDHRGGSRFKFLLLGILVTFFLILILSKVVHQKKRTPFSVVPQAVPTPPSQTTKPPVAPSAPSPGAAKPPSSSNTPSSGLSSGLSGEASTLPPSSFQNGRTEGSLPANSPSLKNAPAVGKTDKIPTANALKVEAIRDTWVGVRIDGGKEMEFPLDRGQWRIFHGKTFRISTDDGGSLMLYLNKGSLGKAGADDQPVREKLIGFVPGRKTNSPVVSR